MMIPSADPRGVLLDNTQKWAASLFFLRSHDTVFLSRKSRSILTQMRTAHVVTRRVLRATFTCVLLAFVPADPLGAFMDNSPKSTALFFPMIYRFLMTTCNCNTARCIAGHTHTSASRLHFETVPRRNTYLRINPLIVLLDKVQDSSAKAFLLRSHDI